MPMSKENILKEAAKALNANPSASLAEIAQAIGIGRTTLHRHFPKRDDLIRALIIYSFGLVDEAMEPLNNQDLTATEGLYAVLDTLIKMGDHFHFLSQANSMANDPEILAIYDRQDAEMSALIDAVKAEGVIAQDVPTVWVVELMNSLVYTAWQTIEGGDIARNSATDLAWRTLTKGIFNPDFS